MTDLDNSLRTVARSVVAEAPPPPAFSSLPFAAPPRRNLHRPLALAATGGSLVALLSAVVVVGGGENESQIEVSGTQEETTASYHCPAEPPLRVTPEGADTPRRDGPAPGSRPPAQGQRAVHWLEDDGWVELRWPAEPQSIYADEGGYRTSNLQNSSAAYPGRLEVDVHPPGVDRDPTMIEPDMVVEPQASQVAIAPCDFLELTAVNGAGRWVAGFRAVSSDAGRFYEQVDLQPRITERRAVAVAPREAIRCQGSDQHGTPPNRSGGADKSFRGAQPAEVLLRYLFATPGAVPSGYVELKEADGSITYAVDPSGDGWTTVLWLGRDDEGWYLEGWTASGC